MNHQWLFLLNYCRYLFRIIMSFRMKIHLDTLVCYFHTKTNFADCNQHYTNADLHGKSWVKVHWPLLRGISPYVAKCGWVKISNILAVIPFLLSPSPPILPVQPICHLFSFSSVCQPKRLFLGRGFGMEVMTDGIWIKGNECEIGNIWPWDQFRKNWTKWAGGKKKTIKWGRSKKKEEYKKKKGREKREKGGV